MESRILIVEDDPLLGEALVSTLSARGYEVRLAADGNEALSVLEQWKPTLILLDLNMPVLDGMAALREIRARPALDQTPVVMMTARPQALPPAEGATRYEGRLQKPFLPDQLLSVIAKSLPVFANE